MSFGAKLERQTPQPETTPRRRTEARTIMDLHPYTAMLTLADLESCVVLENAAFPEGQRCTREKFIYRLTTCGELCLGLFAPAARDSEIHETATTSATSCAPDSLDPERKAILLAHVIATKTCNPRIKDSDMEIPIRNAGIQTDVVDVGHQEAGRTIAVHSVAVLPSFQKKGLGKLLFKAYIQRMADADVADRIAIITYSNLASYYSSSFGFENLGDSVAQFAGVSWTDMVLDLAQWRETE